MSGQAESTESPTFPFPGMLSRKPSTTFLYAGLLFLFAALILFLIAGYCLYRITERGPIIEVPEISYELPAKGLSGPVKPGVSQELTKRDILNFYGRILSVFLSPLLLVISAGMCSFIGIRLLRAAGAVTREVIPDKEYKLLAEAISKGDEKAISQYIRLASLLGMTGTFEKIGLTGLPLATILLTIILAFLGLFNPKLLDLAQLTLGAFIGSYVQKKREESSRLSSRLTARPSSTPSA
jgi:hypothetical protein